MFVVEILCLSGNHAGFTFRVKIESSQIGLKWSSSPIKWVEESEFPIQNASRVDQTWQSRITADIRPCPKLPEINTRFLLFLGPGSSGEPQDVAESILRLQVPTWDLILISDYFHSSEWIGKNRLGFHGLKELDAKIPNSVSPLEPTRKSHSASQFQASLLGFGPMGELSILTRKIQSMEPMTIFLDFGLRKNFEISVSSYVVGGVESIPHGPDS